MSENDEQKNQFANKIYNIGEVKDSYLGDKTFNQTKNTNNQMALSKEKKELLKRIEIGEQTPEDLEFLRNLLLNNDNQTKTRLAKYDINIECGENIHVGDRIYYSLNEEAIRAILQKIWCYTRREENLNILKGDVKIKWIKGVLDKCLSQRDIIHLEVEEYPEAVENPRNNTRFDTSDIFLTTEPSAISDYFEKLEEGRTLLILGNPGSGKTITLLQLAHNLIKKAEHNYQDLIPVILNLSSWKGGRQTIFNWIVQEIPDYYYEFNPRIIRKWLREQKILFLLDGLDEVQKNLRNSCVEAINEFQRNYRTEMVICSRIREYEELESSFRFRAAITIQPLTSQQINNYLNGLNNLSGLQNLVNVDTNLRRLAKSPLMLKLMTVAYKGYRIQDFPEANSVGERQDQLFNLYITRVFEYSRRTGYYSRYKDEVIDKKYIPNKIIWLQWLAKQMIFNSRSIFLIEKINLKYLYYKQEKYLYWVILITSILAICFLFYLPFGWVTKTKINEFALFPILVLIYNCSSGEIKLAEKINWSWNITKSDNNIGFSQISLEITSQENLQLRQFPNQGIKISAKNSVIYLFIGLVSPYIYLCLIKYYVTGILYAAIITYILLFISRSEIYLLQPISIKFREIKIEIYITVLLSTILIILLGKDFISDPYSVVNPIIYFFNSTENNFILGKVVPIIGIYFWLNYGGLATMQHLTLRFILYINNRIPYNYSDFLDWASDTIILQKVGGGYIFIHRLLMEYFAQIPRFPR